MNISRIFVASALVLLISAGAFGQEEGVELPFEEESEHYIVKTNTNKAAAKNIAAAMERFHATLTKLFKPEEKERPKVGIFVFDQEEELRAFLRQFNIEISKNAIGLFIPLPEGKGLICCYRRAGEEFGTLSVLFHEGSHQFVHRVLDLENTPVWLDEGIAVYFESSRFEDNKFKTTVPRTRFMALRNAIKNSELMSFNEFFAVEPKDFHALCYSQAWGVVYFFINANNGAYAPKFANYFKDIRDGKSPDEAFKTLFLDVDKFEALYLKYFRNMPVPAK